MKIAAALLVLGSTSAHQLMSSDDYKFMEFIAKFGKTYGTKAEYNFRLE
jgi:hypothetical protein